VAQSPSTMTLLTCFPAIPTRTSQHLRLSKLNTSLILRLAGCGSGARFRSGHCALFGVAVEGTFLAANGAKVLQGGWLSLSIGVVVFVTMTTWKKGRYLLRKNLPPTLSLRVSSPREPRESGLPARYQALRCSWQDDTEVRPKRPAHSSARCTAPTLRPLPLIQNRADRRTVDRLAVLVECVNSIPGVLDDSAWIARRPSQNGDLKAKSGSESEHPGDPGDDLQAAPRGRAARFNDVFRLVFCFQDLRNTSSC
jgi:hypothetical protein